MIVMPEGFIYIGPVCHLVQDRFGIGPKPCNWPEQPTKAKRQQTQTVDCMCLRMLFLFGDLFRHDVDEPENGEADDRRDHEHDPRDAVGDGIERLALKHGGLCGLREQRRAEQGEEEHRSWPAPRESGEDGWSWCFHNGAANEGRSESARGHSHCTRHCRNRSCRDEHPKSPATLPWSDWAPRSKYDDPA